MTTVLHRLNQLDSQLTNLAIARRDGENVRRIQERAEEWGGVKRRLDIMQEKARILIPSEGEPEAVVSKRKALRLQAATVLGRLQGDFDISGLTRDEAWRRLLNSVKGLADALESAAADAWGKAVEQRGTLEKPSSLRERTLPTPENEVALRRYESSYLSYEAIAGLPFPRTSADLHDLDAHCDACKRAYQKISFDVPAEVGAFFDALQTDAATLAHVTPQVVAWLTEHGQLGSFRVRSARS